LCTLIAELNQRSSRQFVSPWRTAIICLWLGDKQQSLDELEKAYEARSQGMVFLRMGKIFDSVRSDPRFIALMKKVNLHR
jgi:hypothetical protein